MNANLHQRRLLFPLPVKILFLFAALQALADPFWRPEEWNASVATYLSQAPDSPSKPRQSHGLPLALRVELVRIPQFEIQEQSLSEALVALRNAALAADPNRGRCDFLITIDDDFSPSRLSLNLKEHSFLALLRELVGTAGCEYEFHGDTILIRGGGSGSKLLQHDAVNFPLSDALARKWFPEAKNVPQGDNGRLWPAEEALLKKGIPFAGEARADFVPSMNCLSVVNQQLALMCLKRRIEEDEAQMVIQAWTPGQEQGEKTLVVKQFDVRKNTPRWLSGIMRQSKGLLHPDAGTTVGALMGRGIQFPDGATAWYDPSAQKLHVLQTESQMTAITALLTAE